MGRYGTGAPDGLQPESTAGTRRSFAKRVQRFARMEPISPPPARHPLQADDADKVKAILLSAQTERLLLNMNWKVRSNCNMHLRKRATQFGVDVPMDFGAFNVRPRNTPKAKLTPTVAEDTAPHPDAVAALAKLRFA